MTVQDYVVVGRIGKAHGIKGDVLVEPRTDEPERRFSRGTTLDVRSPRPGTAPGTIPDTVTIETVRWHQGRLLARFAEIPDRNAAEAARGWQLTIPVDPDDVPEDADEFYDHQLVGLAVEDAAGARLGTVTGIQHGGAQDLLVLDVDGREVLFPFVAALVPSVDVPGGRLVVDDQPGLLVEESP
jgi:16S rRNA processing protein RimM